ncbi:PQQ-binding-like beta-propeller repeat protein [Nocardia sp. CDC186]|uniref:PQQ-binding-like beta-propeller repeat protein n=1 Tax=Nocardia implantans TaxID=3108168 RepID=A0ABU6AT30_9NOCA|nr:MULTISPECIES: PQQ-binding-like beta-propeller repeat protein [unclassified Nocardia]MBF6190962.1 PQQ-binding-like beta-propeller repeat protein [Nocardia beijingensis]MEA3528953.1 PQQ-binding-like beta-propeller repeat protein [Nocardia sp. CDC192]MEB3510618.1 PQQ-binding-like beta-propeller repeat protein [Nocardia sp. CDC186]
MWRPSRKRAVVVLAAVGALTLAGCGTDYDDITVGTGKGWTAAYHDGRNSGTTPVTGSRKIGLSWQRPVGGPIAQPVTLGPDSQLFVTTRLPNCSIFSFQMATGRKRFCNALGPSAISAPSAVDGMTNVYVGDDSRVISFNYLGQPRWATPVAGTPVSVQFTGDGKLLTISQSGQVDVLSRQTGDRTVPTVQLLGEPDFLAHAGLGWPDAGQGLDDCATGGPHCPVANISPIDAGGRFYVTLWQPGRPAAALVALRYTGAKVAREWSAELLLGGSATSPALSADGATVYVGDNNNRLIAIDTADGRTKWVHRLDWTPRGGISVSDDGLVVPSGEEGYLLALRDNGDTAETAWERKDLALRGPAAQTAGETGYVTAAIGDGLNLVTFDTRTGATIDSDVLPGAKGTTTGTSVGAKGEVVVATRIGEIFAFEPE